ncbi:MAG TPA: glycosyltransferase family 2 protein [Candidatus Dormibacteraeota bacterium]|nr:glycosyltransferase family 2 protein [Candidatus Dormibacteraeota bacterium]
MACGLVVIDLAPFGPAWSRPAGLGLAVVGFALAASTVVRLRRGPEPEQVFWSALLDAVLLLAAVAAVLPVLAIVRGFVELITQAHVHSTRDAIAYALAFTGLLLGGVFFAYAVKYYLSTGIVLLSALLPSGGRRNGNGHDQNGGGRQHASGLSGISRGRGNGNGNGNGNGHANGNANGNGNGYHIDLGYHPFVSVQVAAYNEKRVIERLLTSLDQLDYPAYEVVVVDDSTDESVQILQRWVGRPKFKILHRTSRSGFKGGALREALKVMDPRTEYVVVFDADSMPFPDSIDRFLPYFYEKAGAGGAPRRRDEVAAVQSYQWHVLNKSESWLTEAVRAEYAGSYMIERPFQDAVGALKMVAGTAYMIRADVLRQVGWGTSLTEDWELTLKLYARGYKVAYTPWAETPAECVATFSRLARQRMRWAEGHTHNVRNWFWPIMLSPYLTPIEKLEFAFDATYYLQAALFVVGSVSWLISDVVMQTHVPGWTAVLGWSLLFSNIFALPLMNLGGLILEEAPGRDLQGVLGALVLSFALVPFQGWAALKGLLRKEEGPWFRTPKTGRITDEVHHLRRLRMLRQWLLGPRATRLRPVPPAPVNWISPAPRRRTGWIVAAGMAVAIAALVWGSTRAPVSQAAGNPLYLHGSGTAPCAASTVDQTAGTRTTACSIQSQSGGVITTWAWTNLPAQSITAGTWSFTMYWTGGNGNTLDSVSISAGVVSGSSCALFVPSVPNAGTTWTATYGGSGANTTSPFTVSTSGAQAALSIPAGGSLCVQVTLIHSTGGKPSLVYDGVTGTADTHLTPPSVVVPESLLPFAGLALAIPLVTGRRRLRSLAQWVTR